MQIAKRLAALTFAMFFAIGAAPSGGIIVLGDSMTGGERRGQRRSAIAGKHGLTNWVYPPAR